ncbi:unnamed protein product [Closterium sp. Naga37s-1]|nr:unnamed protein product [Closterium sp. Naga37s-1]
MFSWIASKPAAKEEPPIPKSFDPLKGLGGAVAFYKDVDSQAADAAGSGKLIGSAAAFYANVARERLLEAADAAVPAGSNPSAGNNSTAEICPGVGEINEFLRRGRRCIDSVAPSLADAGEGKAEGGSSVPAPELDLRFGSAAEEPVRWLFKVVIGSEHADLDVMVSAIVYSFFLDHSEPPSALLPHTLSSNLYAIVSAIVYSFFLNHSEPPSALLPHTLSSNLYAIVSAIVYSFFLNHSEPPSALLPHTLSSNLYAIVSAIVYSFFLNHSEPPSALLPHTLSSNLYAIVSAIVYSFFLDHSEPASPPLPPFSPSPPSPPSTRLGCNRLGHRLLLLPGSLRAAQRAGGGALSASSSAHEPGGFPPPHRCSVAAASDGRYHRVSTEGRSLVHTSRVDFHLRTNAAWLLQAMGVVDTHALLFLDEVRGVWIPGYWVTSTARIHLRTNAAWLLQAMGLDTQTLMFLDEAMGVDTQALLLLDEVRGSFLPTGYWVTSTYPPPHRRGMAAAGHGGGHTGALDS